MSDMWRLVGSLPWRYFPLIWPLDAWGTIIALIFGEEYGFSLIGPVIVPIVDVFYKGPSSTQWLDTVMILMVFVGTPAIFLAGVGYALCKKDWWMLGVYLVVSGGPILFYLLAVNDVF